MTKREAYENRFAYTKDKPVCPICGKQLVIDDIDFRFQGNQDNYWSCKTCDFIGTIQEIRYGKPTKKPLLFLVDGLPMIGTKRVEFTNEQCAKAMGLKPHDTISVKEDIPNHAHLNEMFYVREDYSLENYITKNVIYPKDLIGVSFDILVLKKDFKLEEN